MVKIEDSQVLSSAPKTIDCAFCGQSIPPDAQVDHDCMKLLSESVSKGSTSSSSGRNKLSTSLEELFDPLFVSSSDAPPQPQTQVVDKKLIVSESADSDLECPVCLKRGFTPDKIEAHVNECLAEEELAPPALELANSKPSAPPLGANSSDDSDDDDAADDNNNDKSQYVKDQDRHFQIWIKRRAQEEEDRRLALQIGGGGGDAAAAAAPAPASVLDEAESERLARQLQEEEAQAAAQRAAREEAVSLQLARELQAAEAAAEARDDAASERVARELERQEAAAASAAAAEEAMVAEERARVERERRQASDEALARRLHDEEEAAERQRLVEERVAEAKRVAARDARAREERLQREKEALEAQLDAVRFGHAGVVSLPGVVYPVLWSRMADGENQRLVNLNRGCAEWQSVMRNFRVGAPHAHVRQIVRNQNRSLWLWFYLAREAVAKKNGGHINERMLFHGSRTDATMTILQEGFDHRVANLNGALGAGNYFATSSSTSMGYLPRGRHNNLKAMLVCRVILGRSGSGSRGLRRPPTDYAGVRYDSVGSDQSGMFCVFNDEYAFPEYVIYFD